MASSYSTRLKIELINPGEQSGSWGTTTNNNLDQSIEQAIAGVLEVAMGSSSAQTTTLSTGNGPQAQADNQARQAVLRFTGTAGGAGGTHTVQFPAVQKTYMLINSSSTATITMRLGSSGNTTVLLPSKTKLVATDGTNWYVLLNQGFGTNTTTTEWAEKTSAYTAVAGDKLLVDTSAAAITITLPAAPAQGDQVTIVDSEGTLGNTDRALTVEPGTKRIMGETAGDEMVVSTSNAAFKLVYSDVDATNSDHGWRLNIY